MTTEVITIGPDTSVYVLAALLSERGISGVPVVDAGDRVVGIVSVGDLMLASKPVYSGGPRAGAHGGSTR